MTRCRYLLLLSLCCILSFHLWAIETPTLVNITQANKSGFGDPHNRYAFSMESFKGKLYVGTSNIRWTIPGMLQFALTFPLTGTGGQIWQYDENRAEPWRLVVGGGLGNADNLGVRGMMTIGDYLYAVTVNHTSGMEVWRTADGDHWEILVKGGFGNINNTSGRGIGYFHSAVYISVENRKTGAQIWRSFNGHDWELVVTNGLGNSRNMWFSDFVVYDGYLYTGTLNYYEGMSLYRSHDGIYFEPVFTNGLTTRKQWILMKLIVFKDRLFFTTTNLIDGFSLFASNDGLNFKEVIKDGFHNSYNGYGWSLTEYNGRLYLGTFEKSYLLLRLGMFSLLSSEDGDKWVVENDRAFSDPTQYKYFTPELGDYGIRSMKVHNGKLFMGTATAYNSCRVYSAEFR